MVSLPAFQSSGSGGGGAWCSRNGQVFGVELEVSSRDRRCFHHSPVNPHHQLNCSLTPISSSVKANQNDTESSSRQLCEESSSSLLSSQQCALTAATAAGTATTPTTTLSTAVQSTKTACLPLTCQALRYNSPVFSKSANTQPIESSHSGPMVVTDESCRSAGGGGDGGLALLTECVAVENGNASESFEHRTLVMSDSSMPSYCDGESSSPRVCCVKGLPCRCENPKQQLCSCQHQIGSNSEDEFNGCQCSSAKQLNGVRHSNGHTNGLKFQHIEHHQHQPDTETCSSIDTDMCPQSHLESSTSSSSSSLKAMPKALSSCHSQCLRIPSSEPSQQSSASVVPSCTPCVERRSVSMVALECQLPLNGRLSPPDVTSSFTSSSPVTSSFTSSSSPNVSSSFTSSPNVTSSFTSSSPNVSSSSPSLTSSVTLALRESGEDECRNSELSDEEDDSSIPQFSAADDQDDVSSAETGLREDEKLTTTDDGVTNDERRQSGQHNSDKLSSSHLVIKGCQPLDQENQKVAMDQDKAQISIRSSEKTVCSSEVVSTHSSSPFTCSASSSGLFYSSSCEVSSSSSSSSSKPQRTGCKRKLPRMDETICEDDEDVLLGYLPAPSSVGSSVVLGGSSAVMQRETSSYGFHKSPSTMCLAALDDGSSEELGELAETGNNNNICKTDTSDCGGVHEHTMIVNTTKKRRMEVEADQSALSGFANGSSDRLNSMESLTTDDKAMKVCHGVIAMEEEENDDDDDDERGLVIAVVVDDDMDVDTDGEQDSAESNSVSGGSDGGVPSYHHGVEITTSYSSVAGNEGSTSERTMPCAVVELSNSFTTRNAQSKHEDETARAGASMPVSFLPSSSVTLEPTSSFMPAGDETTCVISSEEAESVVEVDVVGVDITDTPAFTHTLSSTSTTTLTLHTGTHSSFSLGNTLCMSPSVSSSSSSFEQTVNGVQTNPQTGFELEQPVGRASSPSSSSTGFSVQEEQERQDSASSNDNNDDSDDDDAFSNYIIHRPQRISPFHNTPKQRKEERRKILKLSITKMRNVEDPEHFLRRSVLINNTMKRLQRELREEKMRHNGGARRAHCYGLYRRATSLHYDVLNGNGYSLAGGSTGSYFLQEEDSFVGFGASGSRSEGEGGGDVGSEGRDELGDDSSLARRLEASSSSPVALTPSPSPCPDVVVGDDSQDDDDVVDTGFDSGTLLSLATTTTSVPTSSPMDCDNPSPCPSPLPSYSQTPSYSPTPSYSHNALPYSPASTSYSSVAGCSYLPSSSTDYCGDAGMTSSYCDVDAASSVSCCLEVSSTVPDPVASLPEELAASPVICEFSSPSSTSASQRLCSASSTSSCLLRSEEPFALPSPTPVSVQCSEAFIHSSTSPVANVADELAVPSFCDGPEEAMEEGSDEDASMTSSVAMTAPMTSSLPFFDRTPMPAYSMPSSPSPASSVMLSPSSSSSQICGGLYEGPGFLGGGGGSSVGVVRDCQSPSSSSSCSSESQREKQLYADIDTVFNNLIHALGDS